MTQLSDVQAFIDHSRRLSEPAALRPLLIAISKEMGFDYVALMHHVDLAPMNDTLTHMADDGLIAVTDYPDGWVEAYVAKDFVFDDPVHLVSHRTNVGFRWDEMSDYMKLNAQHRGFRDKALKADIDEGFTVPANVPGEPNGSCSFATRLGRALPAGNLAMAQLVGSFAFQSARTLVQRTAGLPDSRAPVDLTNRQLECLLFVARGKSDWEISQILGISQETVRIHIRDARAAYDVPKRVQAVLRALFDGRFVLTDVFKR